MSYQVLARKWRPRVFSEMVGQEHVLRALINALDQRRLHHAYLFTGTRGVGKTTIARIFAKCLNCEVGVGSIPCGTCGACREIVEGRFIDLIEVDAASRTKVEDTRELLDNVQYAPVRGRFKVYLIDEVHMLSGHSFNALLKTLEEPPPHIKFLLATTDPQKLPVTVLSRCLQFNLKTLAPERIVEQLRLILNAEKVAIEEAALWSLAGAANGSMRDALSLTDQAIAHGNGKLAELGVSEMLGTVDRTTVMAICRALAARDAVAALEQVAQLAARASDYADALGEMLSVWHRVAIAQTVPQATDKQAVDQAAIAALARQLSAEDVQLFYQICLLGRRDLPFCADLRSGFEMVLLRLLAFQPVLDGLRLPTAIPDRGQTSAGTPTAETDIAAVTPAVDPGSKNVAGGATVSAKKPEAGSTRTAVRVERDDRQQPAEPRVAASLIESLAVVAIAESTPESPPCAGETIVNCDLTVRKPTLEELRPEHWTGIFQDLAIGGVLRNVAANLILLAVEGDCLKFRLDGRESALYAASHRGRLADALGAYFSRPVTVEISLGEVAGETPKAHSVRLAAERKAIAVQTLRDDPLVKNLVERFDGQLLEDTVNPVDQ